MTTKATKQRRRPASRAGAIPPAELIAIRERFAAFTDTERTADAQSFYFMSRCCPWQQSQTLSAIVARLRLAPRTDTVLFSAELVARKAQPQRTHEALTDLADALAENQVRRRMLTQAGDTFDLIANGIIRQDLTLQEYAELQSAPRSALAAISAALFVNTTDEYAQGWLEYFSTLIDPSGTDQNQPGLSP